MVFVSLIIAFQCILWVHKVSGSISKIQDKESDEENTDKTNEIDKKVAPLASKNWARR